MRRARAIGGAQDGKEPVKGVRSFSRLLFGTSIPATHSLPSGIGWPVAWMSAQHQLPSSPSILPFPQQGVPAITSTPIIFGPPHPFALQVFVSQGEE